MFVTQRGDDNTRGKKKARNTSFMPVYICLD
jgi:hypothetical protein